MFTSRAAPSVPADGRALLRRGLRRHPARIAGFISLLTLWQVCETLVPVAIGLVIDKAIAPSDTTALVWSGVGLVALFGMLSYSYRFGSRLGFGTLQHEMHHLRMEIAETSLRPLGVMTTKLSGETLSLATSDTANVGFALRSLGYSVAAAGSLAISAWVLLDIHLGLGLTVLLGVPLVLLGLQALTPVIARRTAAQEGAVASATGVATDLVRGLRVVQGLAAEDEATQRYRRVSRHARIAGIRQADARAGMLGATALAGNLFLAGVALWAGNLALDGEISIGQLVIVVGLSSYLTDPIQVIGAISAQIAQALTSADRIAEHLNAAPEVQVGTEAPAAPATWRSRRPSFTSGPGELLGLVFTDAADADDLLSRLEVGDPGITVAGSPLSTLSLAARRAHLVVDPHHVDLFEATLRETVAGGADIDPGRLERAIDASATTDVVELSPDGVDQRIAADATTHSGGQRQRIGLARALASAPPLLVLHDPTTAVDPVTEHRIARGLRAHRHAATSTHLTWLVTTSPTLLSVADRVLLIDAGDVLAEGTHRDLSNRPDYRAAVHR